MFYTGIIQEKNEFYFFTANMHRRTAKRVYEPYSHEKFKDLTKDEFKEIVKKYYESKDLIILKKKFSQSGRPPRRVVTHPCFIFSGDEEFVDIFKSLRVSFYYADFKETPDLESNLLKALEKVKSENRINYDNQVLNNEEINLLQNDLSQKAKSFGLITFYNEIKNKRVKRY